jgi:hypothetical protein
MRTSLGVLLAALAAGGCSIALDMDRFGKGDENVAGNEVKETGSIGIPVVPDASIPSIDGGTGALPAGDTTPKSNPPPDGGGAPEAAPCTMQEAEPNSTQVDADLLTIGMTACGRISDPKDADWFEYSLLGATTLTIDSHPNVTATLWRNGSSFATHNGGRQTYTVPAGDIQIWVTGNGPGMLAYRITLQ